MKLETTKYKGNTWYNIWEGDTEAIEFLRKRFKFHELDLEDCLSTKERSKLDEYERYLFLILIFPAFNKRTKRIESSEVNIFIGQNYIVTLHRNNLRPLQNLQRLTKESLKNKKEIMGKGTGYFLYWLIDDLVEYCMPIIDKFGMNINEIEQDLFEEEETVHDMLKDILVVKRNIIQFKRIIFPQKAVYYALEQKQKKFLPEDLEIYFQDLIDQIEKMVDMLNNYKEMIEALLDTNEALLSHRTNNIIRILTVFSVVLLPLTFITGVYGMNLPNLPFASSSNAFLIVSGVIVITLIILLAIFKRKKWL